MKIFIFALMIAFNILGCESGDEYHIQRIVEAPRDTTLPEVDDIKQSDHELPQGALSLSNVSVEEFVGTWVHYSKQSVYYRNLDEVVSSGYTAQYIYLSTAGETIVKRDCTDHGDSSPSTWIKTEFHLNDDFSEHFSEEIMRFDGYHYFDDGRLERSYEYEDPFDASLVNMYTDTLVKISDERIGKLGNVSIEDDTYSLPDISAACPNVYVSEYNNSYTIGVPIRFYNLESAWINMGFKSKGGTGDFTYVKPLDSNLPQMWQDLAVNFSFKSSRLSEVFSTSSPAILSAVARVDDNSDRKFSGDLELNFEGDVQLNFAIDLDLPPFLENQ